MKKFLMFVFLAIIFTSCDDEVTVYPIAEISGVEWCQYEITKINTSSANLFVGAKICIPCVDDRTSCPDYTRFVWGAYDMSVKRVTTYCSSCSSSNYFEVGAVL